MTTSERFFDDLARHPQPALRHVSGSIRFDLRNEGENGRYLVRIDDGVVDVSRRSGHADSIARMSTGLFEDLSSGRDNAIAAYLRGDIEIAGSPALLLAFQRLFPGPPAARAKDDIGSSP